MKKASKTLLSASLIALLAVAAGAHEGKETKIQGSIAIDRGPKESEFPGLAKLSLSAAVAAAEKSVAGKTIKAELEEDGGFLIYSVEIVGADKNTSEVKVDAGTGKILAVEKDEEDGEEGGDKDDD
jgi:uncharacterized membrane protein YkoI